MGAAGEGETYNRFMETFAKGGCTTGLFRGTFLLGFPLSDALSATRRTHVSLTG